jgi:hypothetical protein
MHVRAHNPTPVWHYLVTAGLAGAGVAGIVLGRRAHAAANGGPLPADNGNGNGNGNGRGNGTRIGARTAVVAGYGPTGPPGWYDTLMANTAARTAACINQGVRGVDPVKVCVLDVLFPLVPWPPPATGAYQWQWNTWAQPAFNAYVEQALRNA